MSATEKHDLDAIVFAARSATLQLEWVTGGALAQLGFAAADWPANPSFLIERLPSSERQALVELMRATATDGVARRLTHSIIAVDGSSRSFSTEINAIDGGRLLGVAIDATSARYKARRAESELAETVSLLRATQEATTDGILVVNRAGRIVDFNRRFLELWRIPPEVLNTRDDGRALGLVLEQLRDPDAFSSQMCALHAEPEAVSHDVLQFLDGRLVSRDSHPRRVDGEYMGRVWSFRDVTAENRAALRNGFLAAASKVLGTMLSDEKPLESVARLAVPYLGDWCGILLHDERRRLYCTAAHHRDVTFVPRMHKIQLSDVVPESGLGMIVLQARPVAFNDLSDDELSGQASPRRAVTTNDPERLAQLKAMGLRHWMGVPLVIRGKVMGALLFGSDEPSRRYDALDLDTAQDLAQRAALALENQQLYREAHEAVALRDDFLSVASHELRTPMTSLQLAVQSAMSVGLDGPPGFLRQALESAERQTRRLGRLVGLLLDVSRIEAGRLELARATVDLAQLVRDVVSVLSEDLRRAGCAVTLELPDALHGQWDPTRLEQVVTNLLSNAFKYGAGKPIHVTLQRDNERARLTVRDRGIGVPRHERGRIFERFERAVSAQHYGGLGLGLYIVRRIIDEHGGAVRVSDVDGEGAAFTVELPLG